MGEKGVRGRGEVYPLCLVIAKMTSQNRVQTLAFVPILNLVVGLRMSGSSQHTEQCSAGIAQYVEDRD